MPWIGRQPIQVTLPHLLTWALVKQSLRVSHRVFEQALHNKYHELLQPVLDLPPLGEEGPLKGVMHLSAGPHSREQSVEGRVGNCGNPGTQDQK